MICDSKNDNGPEMRDNVSIGNCNVFMANLIRKGCLKVRIKSISNCYFINNENQQKFILFFAFQTFQRYYKV